MWVRILLAGWLSLLSGWTEANEPNSVSSVEFTGRTYQLAFVDVGDSSSITNEYLQAGDTLEQWSSMIAVRHWPKIEEVKEVSGPYLKQVRPLFVRDAQVFSPPPGTIGTDFVLELYLAPPDRSYLEYNLIRFGKEPGVAGVKSYQYALRGTFDLDRATEYNRQKMESRFEALAKLRLDSRTSLTPIPHPASLLNEVSASQKSNAK